MSTAELFAVVIANQMVIMGALRRVVSWPPVSTSGDIGVVLDKQIALSQLLLETHKEKHPNAN